jgi:hypothetical protein
MCRFFAAMSPQGHGPCHLRLFSAIGIITQYSFGEFFDFHRLILRDQEILGVIGLNPAHENNNEFPAQLEDSLKKTGYLCEIEGQLEAMQGLPRDFGLRVVRPDTFNVKLVKDWIGFCQTNHTNCCTVNTQGKTTRVRVIDCQTRQVIDAAEDCEYIALSYVWGPPPANSGMGPRSYSGTDAIEFAPNVIRDSIDVVLKLGFQCLWADQLCIDQQNKVEKSVQLRQMDLIYSKAQFTIIAAAEDARFGLPGAGRVSRKRQPSVKTRNRHIVGSFADPALTIKNSKWATRGWTYQEGLLSNRRLFFTKEQVYFECNGMHCAESVIPTMLEG